MISHDFRGLGLIPWIAPGIPGLEVFESNTPEAWAEWDCACGDTRARFSLISLNRSPLQAYARVPLVRT